jgi:hypothetical protein
MLFSSATSHSVANIQVAVSAEAYRFYNNIVDMIIGVTL